ncbi:hypothetical protein V495_07809 [Pseudogymnoascus sp. VKM F-4514 (FW-929)]|nr:hypothetical protein V495_07809 [Pseudogymnoascus sp. VKM F-4514 (FW-929)]KFY57498.1 hypothetical protein V497_05502 [Pseudogymnoascus sp. VKM F-4516 (FW-969)]
MGPSPHSSRAAIVNKMSPSGKLSAYNIRPSGINQNVSSGKLSAYSTPSVVANQNVSSGKLSAYDLRPATKDQNGSSGKLSAYDMQSFTMDQIGSPVKLSAYNSLPADLGNLNSSGKLSAYSTQSATNKRTTPSGKLSAYDPPSIKRSKWTDSLQVGQYSISFDGECLDDDCSNFCQNSEDGSSKKEIETSTDKFSLDMDDVLNAFGPFNLGGLPSIPEEPTMGPSLRDLGRTVSNPAITNPNLIVYPKLVNRVERYFESRKPTPVGWDWVVGGDPPTLEYVQTRYTQNAGLTDSSTVTSGSMTDFSHTGGPSRPLTPPLDAFQMNGHLHMDDPFQVNGHLQMDDPFITDGGPLQMGPHQMGPPPMGSRGMVPPLPGLPTLADGKPLDPLTVIGQMRETHAQGVQPFGPSRFLNPTQDSLIDNPNGNYLGSMSAASNQMTTLPNHLNTCIWVEGAPGDLTYYEMLRSIRHCGKVYSVHINPPKEKHFTAAAKIAFCTRLGAERFFQQAHSAYGIIIRGRRICVRWNRNKYRENNNRAESRVLRIFGDPTYVNFQTLGEYFRRLFYFNLIWVEQVAPGVMIWEFSSILAQAHSAKQAIEREPAMMNIVGIKYERDPCE